MYAVWGANAHASETSVAFDRRVAVQHHLETTLVVPAGFGPHINMSKSVSVSSQCSYNVSVQHTVQGLEQLGMLVVLLRLMLNLSLTAK